LITGGGSGIGAEIARFAFSHGAVLTLVGRRMPRLEEVCNSLLSSNQPNKGGCFCVQGDMAIKNNVVRTVDQAVAKMGGIDALVLNHAWGVIQFFEDVPFDDLEEAYNLTYAPNVLGNMWLIHKTLPYLKQNQGESHILYVSSLSITYGVPKAAFYASSKLAMHGVIDTLRMELGPTSNIRLTTVNVGAVATELFMAAMISPREEEKAAMRPNKCARLLLEYMVAGRREVMMPLVDYPVPISGYLSWLFPGFMEWVVRNQYGIVGERQGFLKDMGGKPPQ